MSSTQNGPRLVITGMGAVTNIGIDAASTWASMKKGTSGISRIEGAEFEPFRGRWAVDICGQVKGWEPPNIDSREQRKLDRFAILGVEAAIEAVKHSGIDFAKEDPERCGVVIGSGIGGIKTIEDGEMLLRDRGPDRISPFTVPRLMANAAAGNISIRYGLQGPASTHATACASSGHAMGDAIHILRRGEADVMLVGGAEAAVGPICIAAFAAMKALSTRNADPTKASRPFDKARDGFVLSEGAAMFVLETEAHAKARGAQIYAEVLGYANSCDAFHITAPDEQGRGAARSMKWALKDARLSVEQVGYINCHGTSTSLGDKAEAQAVVTIFGDHIRKSAGGKALMSSTKSMTGHCLGASGAVETIACIGALREGVIPPTINLDNPEDDIDIDLVPHHAREKKVDYVMNNTFGFGGHNCTLVFGKYA